MNSNLAIIIPAYKAQYLRDTLMSIANQTTKDFTVYIGDDSSPYDLLSLVKSFETEFNIIYKRFDENLGGKSLVSHWNRCVDLINDEKWIWLFSDDDIMESTCVESFYKSVTQFPENKLWHFNVAIIDGLSNIIRELKPFEERISSESFFNQRINYKIDSFVVEYIIEKDFFYTFGKFDEYDLAWSADDAAWIKFGLEGGIQSINGPKVRWRLSDSNISSFQGDKNIVHRKLLANIQYLKWVKSFFDSNNKIDLTTNFNKFQWIFRIVARTSTYSLLEKIKLADYSIAELGYEQNKPMIYYYIIKNFLRNKVKEAVYSIGFKKNKNKKH